MSRLLSILSMVFFISCINPQDGLIQNKKWRMVKQVVTTVDKTGTSTSERVKDFTSIDSLYFSEADKLTIVSYGSTVPYSYTIKDSILTFWPETAKQKSSQYLIKVSNRDSLVLTRTETWGADRSFKITANFHLAAIKE
jgi:hypothetical protein